MQFSIERVARRTPNAREKHAANRIQKLIQLQIGSESRITIAPRQL